MATDLKAVRIFELMTTYLDLGEGKEHCTNVAAIYNFEITKKKGQKKPEGVWEINLKDAPGSCKKGAHPKPDATFTMTDDDFELVCLGELNPQMAFMEGKMKIKGNMAKATKFTPELFPPPTQENIDKYMALVAKKGGSSAAKPAAAGGASAITGPALELESTKYMDMAMVYMERGEGAEVCKTVDGVFGFDVVKKKGGKPVVTWEIDLKNSPGHVKLQKPAKADATFTMTDDDFVKVFLGELNPQMAFMEGRMKIKGNMAKATKFTPELFPPPTPENLAKYSRSKL